MLRIAVCDDQTECLNREIQLITEWAKERGVTVEICPYTNGDALLAGNASARADVLFLDILMPLLNGMDTARELRRQDTAVQIVFLTSSPEFALESYEVKARDYLLKPVTYERMKKTMDDCVRFFEEEPESLVLKTACGYRKLYLSDMEYAEAQNKRVIFHLKNGNSVETAEPLRVFEERFAKDRRFFKCHRSYLVYMPNVDCFQSAEIVTGSGRRVPIARGCAKGFKEAYFAMMFRE